MATLTDAIDIQPTTPHPDFEPEDEWKTSLRQRIEDTLKPAAGKLKRELTEKLKGLSPPEDSKVHTDYDNAMAELRRTANEQYRQLLERERQERRWAAGEKVDEKWSEILMKEQQALLDLYKKGTITNTNIPEATRDEERSQPPPSAKVPDRASLPPESIARDRMRRPSNILTEPIPEDYPPPRPSLEDREPRPYSNSGSWSRRSNGRDRSASFGSPPRPTPEIWKPSSNESTSRTLAHATGGMTKTRRDSSASIGTTSSFPATIPEDTSLGADKDNDNDKLWGGITRSRQKVRKSSASMDDRVTVAQLFPDFKRDDSAITTSPLTPDSPYSNPRHPSYTISSGRPMMNTRRSFTDESRQPSRWYPLPQTSDPRPIKPKSSFRADDDGGGYPFQSSSPSSGPWNPRSSLEETAPIYPTPSPQDEFRPWKVSPSKPGSIRSRSSINSLRYRPSMAHQTSKHYADGEESISDTEDDSEEDWRLKLEAEYSRRESSAKQMEEEVMMRREEARKKEVELKAKEAETRQREEELDRKEEEAREEAQRKHEELRQKEEELLRKEEEARRKEKEVLAKEEAVKLKEEEARRLAEDAEKREEEARMMEEEARQKEEDARQREREAKKRGDEAKRKEDEARRKEEAARLREEDARKKVEEARKREAELRKKEREAKLLEEDAKRKEEEARQMEEEARKKEEELERKEDEMRQLSDLVEQKEEDARKKEGEARRKEEEARRKEDDIRKREREIRRKEDVLKRREKELQDREATLRTREQQEEEDRRVRQEAADSEAILQATMKEEEIKQKEEELEKREAELERREAEMKAKEEERLQQEEAERQAREEEEERMAKEKREEEEADRLVKEAERLAKEEEERLAQEEADRSAKLEAERLAREEADRLAKEKEMERQKREQRRLEREAADRRREENVRLEQEREEAKRREREEKQKEAERKRREEDRLRAEQLEADRQEALRVEEEWRQEDLRARREEARRADIRNAETKLKEVQRKDEARRNDSGVSETRFMEEQRKLEAQRQRWKVPEDPRRRTESAASYMSTSSTMPSLSESPTKSGAAWTSASSQWTSSNTSTRPTSTNSSQGPIPVRTPTMSTSAGRSSTGGWSVDGAPASGTSPYQATSMSPEEWEKRQQEHARKQQEQFRREQERKERERQARSSKTLNEREIVALFAEHERQWARLKALDDLGWDSFPWPMFKKPTEPEELTSVAIGAYVLSPHHPNDKSKTARDRVKDHIKKWHPDRFETKLLRKVREDERERVREGAGLVARNLSEMLTRSNILDTFS